MEEIGKEYLSVTVDQFHHMKKRAEKAIIQLDEQDLHWKPNEQSNNIAIIIKHLSGNMHSRWVDFFSTDGEKAYRDRENEFIDDIQSKQVLMKRWEEGWKLLFQTVEQLTEEDLLKTVTIRNKPISVLQALQIEIAHISNHLGQILYIGKQIKGGDWKILSIPKKDQ
ncbi:DUF1572 family protein [Bacillus chungangensis]|uniref:DUF1572 domain-containing protein n=1 Tax=Bacillus chungangensis TaxID=587633 RepID=A0ABT9WZM5_9BACI|nr:DUF1572 family protein [Bacillus chungangensis]MDQ0178564.1 hypothetical protein [Bacillus chungangensis]